MRHRTKKKLIELIETLASDTKGSFDIQSPEFQELAESIAFNLIVSQIIFG